LRAASINAGVTLVGGGAAAFDGAANSAHATDPAEALSTWRLDHFRSRMAFLAMGGRLSVATTLLLVYSRKRDRGPNDAVHDCEDRDRDYNAPKGGTIE
jgi:hypothetical protein